MMTSIDGKIMGNYENTGRKRCGQRLLRHRLRKEAVLQASGMAVWSYVATDDNFTFYKKPKLDENAPAVPDGDYVAEKTGMYYVSVDPSGKLGWTNNKLTYVDTTAHVIEVLTEGGQCV